MELYDENIARLIRCSLVGELSEKERLDLEVWRNESEEHDLLFKKIQKEVRASVEGPVFCTLDDEKAWREFKVSVRARKRRVLILKVLRYAAVLVLPLVVAAVFLFLEEGKQNPVGSGPATTITPGGARAVLISSDGKIHELDEGLERRVIEVEKGVMVKDGGGKIVYDSLAGSEQEVALAMNTLKIPRGGEFKLTLADGTNVYLNSASELKYPVRFGGKERRVYLSGEAYFEVAKDAEHPFYVVTEEVQIRVYGTEFNVNTHHAEKVQTVLVNGRIGIKKRDAVAEVTMNPGELASFDRKEGTIGVTGVDVRQYVVWKDGYFAFENETLEQILETLSLWYDVDVFFQSDSAKGLLFTGFMKRYDDISEILSAITDVVGVSFTINGKTIIVSK